MDTSAARDLAGRVALVTGASAGLGLAAARALARRGATLVVSSRGGERLERARAELADLPGAAEVAAVTADVAELADLERLVAAVTERFGQIDVLVPNGGGPPAKPALELTEAVAFLASPAASFVTGQAVAVDGGAIRGLS